MPCSPSRQITLQKISPPACTFFCCEAGRTAPPFHPFYPFHPAPSLQSAVHSKIRAKCFPLSLPKSPSPSPYKLHRTQLSHFEYLHNRTRTVSTSFPLLIPANSQVLAHITEWSLDFFFTLAFQWISHWIAFPPSPHLNSLLLHRPSAQHWSPSCSTQSLPFAQLSHQTLCQPSNAPGHASKQLSRSLTSCATSQQHHNALSPPHFHHQGMYCHRRLLGLSFTSCLLDVVARHCIWDAKTPRCNTGAQLEACCSPEL